LQRDASWCPNSWREREGDTLFEGGDVLVKGGGPAELLSRAGAPGWVEQMTRRVRAGTPVLVPLSRTVGGADGNNDSGFARTERITGSGRHAGTRGHVVEGRCKGCTGARARWKGSRATCGRAVQGTQREVGGAGEGWLQKREVGEGEGRLLPWGHATDARDSGALLVEFLVAAQCFVGQGAYGCKVWALRPRESSAARGTRGLVRRSGSNLTRVRLEKRDDGRGPPVREEGRN
jgi:hypothetical protein